jgi:hypothetical protein
MLNLLAIDTTIFLLYDKITVYFVYGFIWYESKCKR